METIFIHTLDIFLIMTDIDNYIVSEETRRLWNVELDLADVLLDVCQRFDLHIWACFGSLLGAARHKGFIPWDDDLDFVMMREDYDHLTELVKKGIVNPFLPSNFAFDIDDISVLKLRRCDTTAIHPQKRWGSNMNQGVWVDVFCLDVAPDNVTSEINWFKELNSDERLYRNRVFLYYAMIDNFSYKLRHALVRWYFVFHSLKRLRYSIEDRMRSCKQKYSGKTIWPYLCWGLVKEYEKVPRYEKVWFDKTIWLPFEDRKLPCPVGWEHLLVVQYGDWKTPIIGGSLHEGVEIDLDRPYEEVIKERLSKMPFWKRYAYKH